ncbi:hypothetical protein AD945_01200 [Gluconobacter albidus]|uniref:Uncharacterized protein n=1 Tax=Gluconobacter albidus TaxID=318683 RepID=A0A149TN58_9PROT|nr:hypothetical protein [Gluconobacter albidus]KXV50823.1 hypothetical protein AD945_01200 [Gluconobacter albidus]
MPLYCIQKSSDGTIVACSSFSDEKTAVPAGFTVCTSDEYLAAKDSLFNCLRMQARRALTEVQQDAVLAVAMGQTFSPQMQTFVKALQAIADGTDQTSTVLPTKPGASQT